MFFVLNDLKFKYELEKLCRLFLPFEKFVFIDEVNDDFKSENLIITKVIDNDGKQLFTKLVLDGKIEVRKSKIMTDDFTETEKTLALMLFDCFYKITEYRSPWGILTGVRPAKLMGKLINKDGVSSAVNYFKNTLLVNDVKTKLCLECYNSEKQIICRSKPDSFSLYISIPFCPSRCNYCSFVSHSVEQAKRLIPDYVKLLCEEIKYTSKIANEIGLKLQTIYIGGGTPTTLSAEQLADIVFTIRSCFNLSNLEEFTVEAGRPDTITQDKLISLKNNGVTRISINPQTMNDDVLNAIGRRHTVSEFISAYSLARKCGFDNINIDLIAGLDGDSIESFKNTVDKVIELSPESVTVHSLSMKRASNLNKSGKIFDISNGNEACLMVDYAYDKLSNAQIRPYYMYRQSKTIGNLENVGYAKAGFEGLYNVYIMDETHTILACGASAVTKLRQPCGDYIERIYNYKYPYEYISRFNELLERKQGIREFYGKFDFT